MRKLVLCFILCLFLLSLPPISTRAQSPQLANLQPAYSNYIFTPDRLIYKFRNWGGQDITTPFIIRFQWLNKSDNRTPADQGIDYQFTNSVNARESALIDTNNISDQAVVDYVLNQPQNALNLLITLNATQSVTEDDYNNNTYSVFKSNDDLDLVLEAFNYDQSLGKATFTVRNNHSRSLNSIPYQFAWVAPDGNVLKSNSHAFSIRGNNTATIDSGVENSYDTTPAIINLLKNQISGASGLKLLIDSTDKYIESNEENNTKEIPVTLVNGDLEIVSPQYVLMPNNINYRLTFTVHNLGNAAVNLPLSVKFTWFGQDQSTGISKFFAISNINLTNQLAPNESYNFDSELGVTSAINEFLTSPFASYNKLLIELDPDNVTHEIDKSNSTYELTRLLPDYYFENINFDQNNHLTYTLKNGGAGSGFNPLNDLVTVYLKWSTSNNGLTLNYGAHAPGSTYNFDSQNTSQENIDYITKVPPSQDQTPKLLVTIDRHNIFAESDETNNQAEFVGGYVDLVLIDPLLTSEALTFRIKNQGTLTVSQGLVHVIQLDRNYNVVTTNVGQSSINNWVSLDTGSLEAGALWNFNSSTNQSVQDLVNNVISQGGFIKIEIYHAHVEPDNQKIESNEPEYNNEITLEVTTPPELPTLSNDRASGIFDKVKNSWLGSFVNNILGQPKIAIPTIRLIQVKPTATTTPITIKIPTTKIINITPTPTPKIIKVPTVKIIKVKPTSTPTLKIIKIPTVRLIQVKPTATPTVKIIKVPTVQVIQVKPTNTPTPKPIKVPTVKIINLKPTTPTSKVIKVPTVKLIQVKPTNTPTPTRTPTPKIVRIPTVRIIQIKPTNTPIPKTTKYQIKSVLGTSTSWLKELFTGWWDSITTDNL